jgi:DNA-binding transcriptional LysR family regulator
VREALGMISSQLIAPGKIDLATYKRHFRIIVADPFEPILMPPIVRAITTEAPGIEIECVQATARFADDIRNGGIDLACFAFPIDSTDIVTQVLCPIELVILSRRDHPGIRKPLDVDTLRRLPQVAIGRELRGFTGVDKKLIAADTVRRTPYLVGKIWSMAPMIERTDLIGFAPRRFANEIAPNFNLDIHEVPIPLPEQHAYLMWHVGSERDPGHRWLRESMMQVIRTNP